MLLFDQQINNKKCIDGCVSTFVCAPVLEYRHVFDLERKICFIKSKLFLETAR